jgi:CCR4-NOT transcription complex subunit 7/8
MPVSNCSKDTEFPGIVARPIADDFGSKAAYHYQTLRCNVDLLKIIQLGVTLFSYEGDVPPATELQSLGRNGMANNLVVCPCTWTFNFRFSLDDDMYNEASN